MTQTEYFHISYFQYIRDTYDRPPLYLLSDNNLINGKNDCSFFTNGTACSQGTFTSFKFETGKTHRLRLINAGGQATQKFTIDNHEMTVISNDFVPVQPYKTQVVTLGVGQCSDILFKATSISTNVVWMRSDLDQGCFPQAVNQPHALAAIYYPNANPTARPNTTATPWTNVSGCSNVSLIQSVFSPIQAIESGLAFKTDGALGSSRSHHTCFPE